MTPNLTATGGERGAREVVGWTLGTAATGVGESWAGAVVGLGIAEGAEVEVARAEGALGLAGGAVGAGEAGAPQEMPSNKVTRLSARQKSCIRRIRMILPAQVCGSNVYPTTDAELAGFTNRGGTITE